MSARGKSGKFAALFVIQVLSLVALLDPRTSSAAASTLYTYDSTNHLTQATATTGSAVQYQYDPSGNLLGVTALTPTAVNLNQQQNVAIGTAGQDALLTFSASAGDTVTLNFGSISTVPANSSVTVNVYDPSGTLIASTSGNSTQSASMSGLAGGAYTVIVSPQNGATGLMQLSSTDIALGTAPLPLWAYVVLGTALFWFAFRAKQGSARAST